MKTDFDKQLFAKMQAENMQDFSEAEILRVFVHCVAATKCIKRVREIAKELQGES